MVWKNSLQPVSLAKRDSGKVFSSEIWKTFFSHLRTCPFIMLIQWPPITVSGISNPRSAKHFFHTFKDITTCFIQICKNSIYFQIKTSPVLFYFFPNILNVKVCILQTRRSQTSDFNILSFWISICFFIMFSTFANSKKNICPLLPLRVSFAGF